MLNLIVYNPYCHISGTNISAEDIQIDNRLEIGQCSVDSICSLLNQPGSDRFSRLRSLSTELTLFGSVL